MDGYERAVVGRCNECGEWTNDLKIHRKHACEGPNLADLTDDQLLWWTEQNEYYD